MQEPSGLIASPELVNSVTPPAEGEYCEWRVTATHGERIVLNVTQLDIYESDSCETDYLEVRDGYWHKSPLLGESFHPAMCTLASSIAGTPEIARLFKAAEKAPAGAAHSL
ncbi:hypothetical protein HPB48_004817 [Haemaphysalis longicornis]|uniref:CUB domain-containing protein n=1 Tax=Haemaphysalis longicornis TaxID=44386 RepID=A0A9J6FCM7_HAELO|nr:hypothetical protein HPB48_004817 [Haemaphysalis longicornis]